MDEVSLGMVSWIIASITNFTNPSLGLGGQREMLFLSISEGLYRHNIDGPSVKPITPLRGSTCTEEEKCLFMSLNARVKVFAEHSGNNYLNYLL